MVKPGEHTFGQVIRERRRQLDLTQQEVARRINASTSYVGHLESGKRHPSDKIVTRLAGVLGLDGGELASWPILKRASCSTGECNRVPLPSGSLFAKTGGQGATITSRLRRCSGICPKLRTPTGS